MCITLLLTASRGARTRCPSDRLRARRSYLCHGFSLKTITAFFRAYTDYPLVAPPQLKILKFLIRRRRFTPWKKYEWLRTTSTKMFSSATTGQPALKQQHLKKKAAGKQGSEGTRTLTHQAPCDYDYRGMPIASLTLARVLEATSSARSRPSLRMARKAGSSAMMSL